MRVLYNGRVPNRASALVDILREFLAAHRLTRRLFARYRSGELRFEELEDLVGDDEHSVLFRLKGRCHALFRRDPGHPALAVRREALFDLAVGSLFHEAMKFRENFYQREVYGPRVRALRTESGGENAALFQEFEKILSARGAATRGGTARERGAARAARASSSRCCWPSTATTASSRAV